MSTKTALYLRVSTLDQNLDIQEQELLNYLKNKPEYQLTEIYKDKCTGTSSNRPNLKRLLQDARAKKVDTIIVWKLDRFFRSLKDLMNTLAELNQLGITFVSIKDNIDLSTPTGRLMLQILGAFAEFEAGLIRERTRTWVKYAKENNIKLGRHDKAQQKIREALKKIEESVIQTNRENEIDSTSLSIRQLAALAGVSKSAAERYLRKQPRF